MEEKTVKVAPEFKFEALMKSWDHEEPNRGIDHTMNVRDIIDGLQP